MNVIKRIFDLKGTPILAAVFVILFIAERRHPLRKRKAPNLRRLKNNALVAFPSFGLLRLLFLPLMVRLTRYNQHKRIGINYAYEASPLLKSIVAFLLMDYSNYLWHVLNHRLPVLWRFHLVHHIDVDLDLSTAIRFHFGELIGSVFFRGLFVFISSSTAVQVLLYEILFEAATQFHHSNLALPERLEKILNLLIVTPRMHGIHHSKVRNERDSNYAVIFSFWDRLHQSLKLDVDQDRIDIGVPAYSNADEFTAISLLKLPFSRLQVR
jgi:sterol desaturase/sphingolipid hydroxylase (fatty acid hydroxylase superfamily)